MLTSTLGINNLPSSIIGGETSVQNSPQKELGKDDFLTLLVTQLRHQDPLNPLESVEFTAQLAQFSSLEQLFGMNDNLVDIQDSLTSQEDRNVLDYIGKTVRVNDNTLVAKNGTIDNGVYHITDSANVTLYIYDDAGRQVRSIDLGWKNPGEYTLNWDGRTNDGLSVSDGFYTFEILAIDKHGSTVQSTTAYKGEVDGVTYEDDIPYLMVGNRRVIPEEIIEVTKISG